MKNMVVLLVLGFSLSAGAESLVCEVNVSKQGRLLWTKTVQSPDLTDLGKGMWYTEGDSALKNEKLDINDLVTATRLVEGVLVGNLHIISEDHCNADVKSVLYRNQKQYSGQVSAECGDGVKHSLVCYTK